MKSGGATETLPSDLDHYIRTHPLRIATVQYLYCRDRPSEPTTGCGPTSTDMTTGV
jgi:hypothetical protein